VSEFTNKTGDCGIFKKQKLLKVTATYGSEYLPRKFATEQVIDHRLAEIPQVPHQESFVFDNELQ
jgi:hypothetical protein